MPSSTSSSERNDFRRFLGRFALMTVLLAIVLYPLSKIYDKKVPAYSGYKQHWMYLLKNQHYDYAFIGASRVGNSIMPVLIDSVLHTNGVNLGTSGGTFAENLLSLQTFYRNGNTTKVLLIEATTWMLSDPSLAVHHPFAEEKMLNMVGVPGSDSILQANSNGLKHYFRRFLPFFKYAEYNNLYPLDRLVTHEPNEKFDYTREKGFINFQRYPDGIWPEKKKDSLVPVNRPVFHESLLALEKLIELAQQHHAQVILYTAPTYAPILPSELGRKAAQDTLNTLALRYKIPYRDFETLPYFTDKKDFSGYSHLSRNGCRHFSLFVADTLAPVLSPAKNSPSPSR